MDEVAREKDSADLVAILQQDFYTLRQVADIIGRDISTVHAYLRDGVFPHAYKGSPNKVTSEWRVPQCDLDAYFAAQLASMPVNATDAKE